MHVFSDTKDRKWELCINTQQVKRVRGYLKLDIYSLVDDGAKGLGEILGDPVTLVDVLYVLCKGQCDEQEITDEQFGEGFSGDVLAEAADAFVEELIDFFPNPDARTTLRRAISAGKQAGIKLLARANQELDSLNIDSLAEKLLASSGPSLADLGSTQHLSVSGS